MLTPDQVEQFEHEGYLVLEDVVPRAARDAVESEYSAVLRDLAQRFGVPWQGSFLDTLQAVHLAGHDWFQPLDISLPGDRITAETPFHYGPSVHALLTSDALVDIASSLLGPKVTSTPIQHVRLKPPQSTVAAGAPVHTSATAWHQDRGVAHPEADQTEMVTVWIAMSDATIENSCLVVQPKDPEQQMLPHCPMDQTAIPAGQLAPDRRIPLPVKAGGVVLLHPMTPHAAGPNKTDGFRWSFDVRYQRTGQPTGRAHFPDFPVRGAPVPDWQDVNARWQAARLASAAAAHIPIHRWTSDSPACA